MSDKWFFWRRRASSSVWRSALQVSVRWMCLSVIWCKTTQTTHSLPTTAATAATRATNHPCLKCSKRGKTLPYLSLTSPFPKQRYLTSIRLKDWRAVGNTFFCNEVPGFLSPTQNEKYSFIYGLYWNFYRLYCPLFLSYFLLTRWYFLKPGLSTRWDGAWKDTARRWWEYFRAPPKKIEKSENGRPWSLVSALTRRH